MAKYQEWLQEDKLILLQGWARDGLSDEQIADNMGIATSTYYEWKKKHTEFSEALKKNKEIVDIEVENALLKRALGYTIKITEQKIDKDGCVHDLEKDVHIPPDTTAQIYWLKHRQREKWGEKETTNNNDINQRITNIANLLNNPQPNRSDDDVQ